MLRVLFALLSIVIVVTFYFVNHQNKADVQQRFYKHQYSLTNASSLWVVVNKQHPLQPQNYMPTNLHKVGYGQTMAKVSVKGLVALMVAAKKAGLSITFESGYRSFESQQKAYDSLVSGYGQEHADKESAKPGYSEHQTGLAMDFGNDKCKLRDCFSKTKEGKWLIANSYKYGFILRYPGNKSNLTGYKEEAWHFRYVGKELAAELYSKGNLTLEEYFGLKGGETYK